MYDGEKWREIPSDVRVWGRCKPRVCNGTLYISGTSLQLYPPTGPSVGQHLAKYDGTRWVDARGDFPGGMVVGPMTYGTDTVVAYTNGSGGSAVSNVARWDGSAWVVIGTMTGAGARVEQLFEYDGDLIASGAFVSVNGMPMSRIARWDGTQWHPLSTGLNAGARSFVIHNGELIAGGPFTVAGGVAAPSVARWNGTEWLAFDDEPVNGAVSSLVIFQGSLYACGPTMLSGRTMNMIARWDDTEQIWKRPGSGLSALAERANQLLVFQDSLYIAGLFDTAGGLKANHLARWNGSQWDVTGQGVSGQAYCFTEFNGELVGGGTFEWGTEKLNHIGRWDGARWRRLGSGFQGPTGGPSSALVHTVHVHDGQLFAGGSLGVFGASTHCNVAFWNGTAWQAVGGGLGGSADRVMKMLSYEGKLIACGSFFSPTGAHPSDLAAWDGVSWQPVGGAVPSTTVSSMDIWDGKLLICGQHTIETGAGTMQRLAKWNGTVWEQFPLPDVGSITAIRVAEGQLIGSGQHNGQTLVFIDGTKATGTICPFPAKKAS